MFLLSLEIRIWIFHSAIDHLKIHTRVLWLSGPDSIKTTPSVTYDLILSVVKNTDSNQIHGDVTIQTLKGSLESDLMWKCVFLGSKSQRKATTYELNSAERRSAATIWARCASSRPKGYLRFSSTVGLHSPARHISMSLADTVADTRWQSGFCKCGLQNTLVNLSNLYKMPVCL